MDIRFVTLKSLSLGATWQGKTGSYLTEQNVADGFFLTGFVSHIPLSIGVSGLAEGFDGISGFNFCLEETPRE